MPVAIITPNRCGVLCIYIENFLLFDDDKIYFQRVYQQYLKRFPIKEYVSLAVQQKFMCYLHNRLHISALTTL